KRLQVFRPELVHLKGNIEQNSPREGIIVSFNLRLPSGQMAVQESASTAPAAIKAAVDDLLQQITKHKDLLRSSHKWRRRRAEKPERLALEPWLYRLAIRSINDLAARGQDDGSSVRLEESARRPNVRASDEPELQYHQPDEALTEENVIADTRVATPEEIAYSDEMITLVQFALEGAKPRDREAFILQ